MLLNKCWDLSIRFRVGGIQHLLGQEEGEGRVSQKSTLVHSGYLECPIYYKKYFIILSTAMSGKKGMKLHKIELS